MNSVGAGHRGDATVVRLDLVGAFPGRGAERVGQMIAEAIVVNRPDKLIVDLDAVVSLSFAGVQALVSAYVTAIDFGTSYHVINAHGAVRRMLRDTGTLEVLADSEDLGALLLALLVLPVR